MIEVGVVGINGGVVGVVARSRRRDILFDRTFPRGFDRRATTTLEVRDKGGLGHFVNGPVVSLLLPRYWPLALADVLLDRFEGRVAARAAAILDQEVDWGLSRERAAFVAGPRHREEHTRGVVVDKADSVDLRLVRRVHSAVARGRQRSVAGLRLNCLLDQRVSSVGPVNAVGQVAQIALLLIELGDALLVWHF